MSSLRHRLANSSDPTVLLLRRGLRLWRRGISLALPPVVFLPWRLLYTGIRSLVFSARRILIAEPIFRSYCTRIGKNFRTDVFVHWVSGRGIILIGDDVIIDGKSSFHFASRWSTTPTLRIGNLSGIGHGCTISVAREVSIGNHCRISSGVVISDASGHPLDPVARRRGDPTPSESVRPVVIEDDVWIGRNALLLAGVRIGEGSVISAGAVVMSDVAPFSLMAGNPARRIGVTQQVPDPASSPTPIGAPS